MEETSSMMQVTKAEIAKVVVGQTEVIEGILAALIVGGHVLLEGPPGVGKTLIAKAIAKAVSVDFKRVQFTPDLMPLDITGTNIFDPRNQQFSFHPGPVFTDLLLADEINRTPPKTQAALLEAMEERQVTVDGTCRPLSPVFTVIATENPIEYEGTYPLPEAQQDRFLFKLRIDYPSPEAELEIYRKFGNGSPGGSLTESIRPVLSVADILRFRAALAGVRIQDNLHDYIFAIVKATRESHLLTLGASPRAGINLLLAAKANALLEGRDYLIPEDIQEAVLPVLRHRLLVKPEALIDGKTSDQIIRNIIAAIKIPR